MKNYIEPSFLVGGSVKCGTSSLYRYLNEHPQIVPCKIKEPQYLSSGNPIKWITKYQWYKSQFIPKNHLGEWTADWVDLDNSDQYKYSEFRINIEADKSYITGEASASTLINGNPRFVNFLLPKLKLVFLMRNPVDRFISHYNMLNRFKERGRERLQSLPNLVDFTKMEVEKARAKEKTKILHYGDYLPYLKKWQKVFGNERIKIYSSTDLKNESKRKVILTELYKWLELPAIEIKETSTFNVSSKAQSSSEAKEILQNYYQALTTKLDKALTKQSNSENLILKS